ncbi:MAG: hypothetical protein IAE82_20660 [Opitutaceae bacterium]|nr:hypothetical protein [Opitutaceae bacterium]
MNKTLLLIICDFLLLNLLALTRWEKPPEEPPPPSQASPAQTAQQVVQEDLVGALRATLEEERSVRTELSEELQQREETLAERERRMAALSSDLEKKAQEARQLSERVADSQVTVAQLSDRLTQTAAEAATKRAQAEQLAKELAEKQAAAERLAQQVSTLEQEKTQAHQQIQTLNTQVQVANTERVMLRETMETLRTQVTEEREEKLKLQEQTGKLAEGVTQLAENSAGIREEMRASQPLNANTLFSDFSANRVQATFRSARENLFGPVTRNYDARTILVSDGADVFALLHVNDTAATFRESPADWREIEGRIAAGSRQLAVERLRFLVIDPRVVVVKIDPTIAAGFGVRIYPTAAEPFKFSEAVIISQGGKFYGEVEFKLDPQTPGYVKMKTRIFSSLFGEFSPSAGDVVLSKTGELLGLMVTDSYCVLIDNFAGAAELPFGTSLLELKTSEILARQKDRVLRMPVRLQ